MNALGLNLQRLGATRKNTLLNLVGVALAASCGLVDMVSFSFAAQSLLAPFGGLSLIINLLLAAPMHGDRVGSTDLAATAFVVSGVALCLANASTDAADRTYEDLNALASRPAAHAWLCALGVAFVATAAKLRSASPAAGPRSAARFCYPLLAGMVGSCTALTGKAVGELTKAAAPWRLTACVGALLPLFGIGQTVLLNTGVSRFSSLVVVPVFVATFVTCNAVGGGLLFDEFGGMSSSQKLVYPVGLVAIVRGVLLLAKKKVEPAGAAKKKN